MKFYLIIKAFFFRHLSPTRIFVSSFALFILLGALFLWLPFSASNTSLRFIDALFTATSAVCVTGLTVLNVGRDLSLIGQVITMLLFQVGGLGIITFSIVLFTLMGRGISFKGREICQATFLHTPRRDFYLIVKKVLLYSFVCSGGSRRIFLSFRLFTGLFIMPYPLLIIADILFLGIV